jgi:F-box-like
VKQIDVLPNDVLLEVFDLYMIFPLYGKREMEAWQSLAHVCRRWRSLVFRSPCRLNLQLFCTPETPARDKLDIWPALPLRIVGEMTFSSGIDNIIAALEQSNRVSHVFLYHFACWQLEQVLAQMQIPFPELTDLQLTSSDETVPVIPDSFLDGSAPLLQYFHLSGIQFPGLPKLLLSTTRLVYLGLSNIPHSGYISPEAMVALLSPLSSLDELYLGFRSPESRPDWKSPSLPSQNALFSPLSTNFISKALSNI